MLCYMKIERSAIIEACEAIRQCNLDCNNIKKLSQIERKTICKIFDAFSKQKAFIDIDDRYSLLDIKNKIAIISVKKSSNIVFRVFIRIFKGLLNLLCLRVSSHFLHAKIASISSTNLSQIPTTNQSGAHKICLESDTKGNKADSIEKPEISSKLTRLQNLDKDFEEIGIMASSVLETQSRVTSVIKLSEEEIKISYEVNQQITLLEERLTAKYGEEFSQLGWWHGRSSFQRILWQDEEFLKAITDSEVVLGIIERGFNKREKDLGGGNTIFSLMFYGLADNQLSYLASVSPNWAYKPKCVNWSHLQMMTLSSSREETPRIVTENYLDNLAKSLDVVKQVIKGNFGKPDSNQMKKVSTGINNASISDLLRAFRELINTDKAINTLTFGAAGNSTLAPSMARQCFEVMMSYPQLLERHKSDLSSVFGYGLVSHALDARHLAAAIYMINSNSSSSYTLVEELEPAKEFVSQLLQDAESGRLDSESTNLLKIRLQQLLMLVVLKRDENEIKLDRIISCLQNNSGNNSRIRSIADRSLVVETGSVTAIAGRSIKEMPFNVSPVTLHSERLLKETLGKGFPKTLSDAEVIEKASKEITFIKFQDQKFAKKQSAVAGQGYAEFSSNKIYRALGVPVSEVALYSSDTNEPILEDGPIPDMPIILTKEILNATPLLNIKNAPDRLAQVREKIQQNFVLDCLLGNINVLGSEWSNILVLEDNTPVRINTSSTFGFNDSGKLKFESLSDNVLELDTFLNLRLNPAATIYKKVSDEQLVQQIDSILSQRQLVLVNTPEKYRKKMQERIAYLEEHKKRVLLNKEKEIRNQQILLDDPNRVVVFDKNLSSKNLHLNGVSLENLPASIWRDVQDAPIGEPPFIPVGGKATSAGMVIIEADGRAWLYEPVDHSELCSNIFPAAAQRDDLSLQQTARKEVYEKLGLHVEPIGFLMDQERASTKTRYYVGRRTGGDPSNASRETNNIGLIPLQNLEKFLHSTSEKEIGATVCSEASKIIHRPLNKPILRRERDVVINEKIIAATVHTYTPDKLEQIEQLDKDIENLEVPGTFYFIEIEGGYPEIHYLGEDGKIKKIPFIFKEGLDGFKIGDVPSELQEEEQDLQSQVFKDFGSMCNHPVLKKLLKIPLINPLKELPPQPSVTLPLLPQSHRPPVSSREEILSSSPDKLYQWCLRGGEIDCELLVKAIDQLVIGLKQEEVQSAETAITIQKLYGLASQKFIDAGLSIEAFQVLRKAAESFTPSPTHPLHEMNEAVQEGSKKQCNPKFGAYFSSLGGGNVRGHYLQIFERPLDGGSTHSCHFQLTSPKRSEVDKTIGNIMQNVDAFAQNLPETLKGCKVTAQFVDYAFKVRNPQTGQYDVSSGNRPKGAKATEITFEGIGKVIIGASSNLTRSFKIIVESFQSMGLIIKGFVNPEYIEASPDDTLKYHKVLGEIEKTVSIIKVNLEAVIGSLNKEDAETLHKQIQGIFIEIQELRKWATSQEPDADFLDQLVLRFQNLANDLSNIKVPAVISYGCLENEVAIEFNSNQPPGGSLTLLHQMATAVGLGPIVLPTPPQEIKRLKMAFLFRTFFPAKAFPMERMKEFYEIPINHLQEWIESYEQGMKAIFKKYFIDKPDLLVEEETYPGKRTWSIRDLSEQVRVQGGWGLMASVGNGRTFESAAQSVCPLLRSGALSTHDRYRAGLIIPGASSEVDLQYGGGDYVFSRLIGNPLSNCPISSYDMVGSLQVLYDLEAINSGAFAYEKDRYGAKHESSPHYEYYKNRLDLPNFTNELSATRRSNEVMVKGRIDPRYIRGLVVQSHHFKNVLLKTLRQEGLVIARNGKEFIMGKPVDEFIHVGRCFKEYWWNK